MDIAAALARDSRRRIVPTWLVIVLAVRRGCAAWADGERRERSLAVMTPLARTPEQRERLARRHLIEDTVREALLEQLWAFPRVPQTGRAALEAARAGGRGVLVSYCHYGPFPWMARSFTALSGPVTAVVGSWVLEEPSPDPRGLRIARWHRGFVRSGVHMLAADGCYREVAELLGQGRLVTIAFDLPGPEPGRLLGLPVSLASGTARLAFETSALVVPAARTRHRHRVRTDLAPPLDPRRFGSWQEVHRAIAAAHDELMAAKPWAHETPLRAVPRPQALSLASASRKSERP